MHRLEVVAVGEVDEEAIEAAGRRAALAFGLVAARRPSLPAPAYAFDPARRQYESTAILRAIVEARDPAAARVLAVTEVDLCIPMLTFVFGQAQLDGSAALVSLARLRQEYYGLPANRALLVERAGREALHEMGHTFGLVHCPEPPCAMSLSHNVRQIDARDGGFCPGCRALIAEARTRLDAGIPGLAEEAR